MENPKYRFILSYDIEEFYANPDRIGGLCIETTDVKAVWDFAIRFHLQLAGEPIEEQ